MFDGLDALVMHFSRCELKFVDDGAEAKGMFTGYASVFNMLDHHRDIMLPGAFDATLADWKAMGAMPTMYIQHEQAFMPGARPAGKWLDINPDEKGLAVKGQLIALDTEWGRTNYALVRDGGLPGLSIAFRTAEGGAVRSKGADGEKIRQIKALKLYSIDLVAEPSNGGALVQQLKAMLTMPNHQAAADALQSAHQMCLDCMGGGDAPTTDERNQITGKVREAYKHITGNDMPTAQQKSAPDTIREFESLLRDAGYSDSVARQIAAGGFKSATPRDEGEAAAAKLKALSEMRGVLSGFTLRTGA
jgi:hypothetical protein